MTSGLTHAQEAPSLTIYRSPHSLTIYGLTLAQEAPPPAPLPALPPAPPPAPPPPPALPPAPAPALAPTGFEQHLAEWMTSACSIGGEDASAYSRALVQEGCDAIEDLAHLVSSLLTHTCTHLHTRTHAPRARTHNKKTRAVQTRRAHPRTCRFTPTVNM